VVLKRCCACTTLILSYDADDDDDDDDDTYKCHKAPTLVFVSDSVGNERQSAALWRFFL